MTNENSQKVIQNVENHIHLPPTDSKSKPKRSKPNDYRWLWTLVIVPIIVAVIYNWDKLIGHKEETGKSESACEYLRQQLSTKSKEFENIKNLLLTTSKEDYLRLSSDSMSHAIQINLLNDQLKEKKCIN